MQLRASSSSFWFHCALYPRFIANLPEQPASDAAREGTCAAWVAEKTLRREVAQCSDLIGAAHENGWIVEKQMADLMQKYVDFVVSIGGMYDVERTVYLNEYITGTTDLFAIIANGVLYVIDLKYGFMIVEPYRNTQIAIYAASLLKKYGASEVRLGVYQPRAFHPLGIYREWRTSPQELMAFAGEIEAAGNRAQDPNATATPGKWCEHCDAAHTCQALAETLYKGHHVIESSRQKKMTGEELAKELDFFDLMETLLKSRSVAVKAEATARAKSGEFLPGYSLETGYGNRKLNISAEEFKFITGIDPYEKKTATPAELVRRGASEKLVDGLSSRPTIPPKLKKISDGHFPQIVEGKRK